MIDAAALAWDKMGGLIPAVVQAPDGRVLMLGYVDRAALDATMASGTMTFFSRSKGRLWVKGETSGNRLAVRAIAADCDGDALLVTAEPMGPTCHLGTASCFGAAVGPTVPARIAQWVAERRTADPATSYTARLERDGLRRVAQKVGEEGVEVALAASAGDADELADEAADLMYHLTLLLGMAGSSWAAVADRLEARHAASIATAAS